ncbi:MAG: hypothetical protein HQ568_02395 [Calditrichaeota bacterium]|nr:hypothetical protein [Calditrichota bacterium]
MDSLIHILYFDTTKLGVNDPTSLYRAISHIRLKPLDERARKNGDYGFKKTDDSSNISFRINKPDFIEFLIRNSIYRCSFHKSIRRFNSDDSNISPDGEPAILCKLIVYLPEYSYQDQLIQELEAKEYIFNVSKRKYKDPHPG